MAFRSQGMGGCHLDELFFVKVSANTSASASFGASSESRDDSETSKLV